MLEDDGQYNNTIMVKILGPVVRFVDRPRKVLLVQSSILFSSYDGHIDVHSRRVVWIW